MCSARSQRPLRLGGEIVQEHFTAETQRTLRFR